MATVRVVGPKTIGRMLETSEKTDDLLISYRNPWVARAGIVLVLPTRLWDVMLLYMARPHNVPTTDEIVDLFYSHCEDGGPLDAAGTAHTYKRIVTRLFPLLGIRKRPSTGTCREISIGPPPSFLIYDRVSGVAPALTTEKGNEDALSA